MQIPFLLKTAAWVQVLPPLALLLRRNLSRPVLWVAAGATVSVVGNAAGIYVAHRSGNNHWLGYIDGAVMFSLYLVALAEWQVTYVERLTLRLSILPFLIVYVLLVYFVEDITTFSRYGYPMYSIALLGAAVWTLLRRAFQPSTLPIQRSDWFWVVGGLALYGATTAVSQPVSAILLAQHRVDLLVRVYEFRAVCIDIAFLAIVAGFLLPPSEAAPAR